MRRDDDAQRAVACAITMQLAIDEVNARNKNAGYPEIHMGIGIHTGDVVVGNIGSSKHTKYGVFGGTVNLASRIESYTVGGQILISKSTLDACGEILRIDGQMTVMPKGVKEPLAIYDIGGIGGKFHIFLPKKKTIELVALQHPLPVKFTLLEGKHSSEDTYNGSMIKLKDAIAEIQAQRNCRELTNLKISIFDSESNKITADLYAKVSSQCSENPPIFRVNFTFVPPEAEEFFKHVLGFQIKEEP